jgi:O-6-methylguanine DNA methyltransferase
MALADWIEPLKIGDARRLQQTGILADRTRTLADVRNQLRLILAKSNHHSWLVGEKTESGNEIRSIVSFEVLDLDAGRMLLRVYPNLLSVSVPVLQEICRQAQTETSFFRIEALVPAKSESAIQNLRTIGFCQEGILRLAHCLPENKMRQDVRLLALLRPEVQAKFTAFLLFRLGVFVITGHEDGLQKTDFVRFGDPFTDLLIQERAELAGLLDNQGFLKNTAFLPEKILETGYLIQSNAPEPVRRAVSQVRDYFSGQLTEFDIPLDLSSGSAFQVRVWQALAEIPFGTTWTYEELAYQLTDDDWQAARNMARAVGAACAANPIPLILPCHRVIGKDGRLVGFSGGLDVKEYLLEHELMGVLSDRL